MPLPVSDQYAVLYDAQRSDETELAVPHREVHGRPSRVVNSRTDQAGRVHGCLSTVPTNGFVPLTVPTSAAAALE